MPGSYLPVTLRLEPHMLPAVRAAFEEGLTELRVQIFRVQREAVVPEPWLGDATSEAVLNFYHRSVIESPEGPYAALKAYEAELIKIRDTLQQMEDRYRHVEGENSALWGQA